MCSQYGDGGEDGVGMGVKMGLGEDEDDCTLCSHARLSEKEGEHEGGRIVTMLKGWSLRVW